MEASVILLFVSEKLRRDLLLGSDIPIHCVTDVIAVGGIDI